jgi:hypothetical protein
MYHHHAGAIHRVEGYFEVYPQVISVILMGSITHRCEFESSNIDNILIISDEEYENRPVLTNVKFYSTQLYDYINGKYLIPAFIRAVAAERGAESMRHAFEGAQVLSRIIDGFEKEIRSIVRYPVVKKIEPTNSIDF